MFSTKLDPKMERVKDAPLLRSLAPRDLRAVAKGGDLVQFGSGRVLAEEDAYGAEVFLIVEGTVAVEHDGSSMALLGAGDFAGEMALLDDGHRSATLRTQTPVTALVFDRRAFDQLRNEVPAVERALARQLSARLRGNLA